MDIVGLGTEIVECARVRALIEQHGERFLNRVYTDRERSRWCQARTNATEHFAAVWAAKEAVFKCPAHGRTRGLAVESDRNRIRERQPAGQAPGRPSRTDDRSGSRQHPAEHGVRPALRDRVRPSPCGRRSVRMVATAADIRGGIRR